MLKIPTAIPMFSRSNFSIVLTGLPRRTKEMPYNVRASMIVYTVFIVIFVIGNLLTTVGKQRTIGDNRTLLQHPISLC